MCERYHVGKRRCCSSQVPQLRYRQRLGKTHRRGLYEDEYFHAHQDVAYPIPGLIILASKRHFYRMDELTAVEATEYITLIQRIRAAQSTCLGIDHVYYFYNEDTTHHFHLWMVPRYEWMRQFGSSVESLRPSLLHARNAMNSEENVAYVIDCIDKLRNALLN